MRRDDEAGTGSDRTLRRSRREHGPGTHEGIEVVSRARERRDGRERIGLGLVERELDDVHAASHEGLADTGHVGCRHVAPDGDDLALEHQPRDGWTVDHGRDSTSG